MIQNKVLGIHQLASATTHHNKMLTKFLNDERGISAEVFKLAVAVIVAAAVLGIIIGLVVTFKEIEAPVERMEDSLLNETQSNAEEIEK